MILGVYALFCSECKQVMPNLKKMETKLKIDISTEKENFKKHLNLINNNQIIFSGIFGIGKTYFLKEFLKDNEEKYESILLSPVNYSISQTDDILQYIEVI
jgi:hypothetical protein